ncbi:MAG: ABC transporter ATP-binding protein [Trueperaceae bacterium]|nr:MAG: ABC transporter ATP-binding protein [Trueperaceae bacterium]
MNLIEMDRVTKRFDDLIALRDVSLTVAEGEVFGVLGHNGAGKTTSVRLLNGVLKPDGGRCRVLGLDPNLQGARLRRQTGVLTETPAVDERLTARENLAIYADLYGVPVRECSRRVDALLLDFALLERADDKVSGYSKGMKQRLALARALLHQPKALFLDEPTAGLDPVAAHAVHQLIEQLSGEGRVVFLCTHNLAEAQRLCDRVAVLERGRIIALGSPDELARQVGGALRLDIEVRPEQVPAALDLLGRAGLEHVEYDAETLAVSGVARDRVPEIVQLLVDGGVSLYRVAPREPSLEEVYFALHAREEA